LLEFGAKTKAYILYLILLHLVFLICTMGFFIPMAYGVNYNTQVFSRYYSFLVSICKEISPRIDRKSFHVNWMDEFYAIFLLHRVKNL